MHKSATTLQLPRFWGHQQSLRKPTEASSESLSNKPIGTIVNAFWDVGRCYRAPEKVSNPQQSTLMHPGLHAPPSLSDTPSTPATPCPNAHSPPQKLVPHSPDLRSLALRGEALESQLYLLASTPISLAEVESRMAESHPHAFAEYAVVKQEMEVRLVLAINPKP